MLSIAGSHLRLMFPLLPAARILAVAAASFVTQFWRQIAYPLKSNSELAHHCTIGFKPQEEAGGGFMVM